MNTFAGERGQALPLIAICLAALLGFAALAVDIGFLQYKQRTQQTAADSAAIAGATELAYGSATTVTSSAKTASAANGFTDGTNNTTVTVNTPPASGNYQISSAVEAIVKATYPSFFSRIFGMSSSGVSTRAVAIVVAEYTDCYYALDPTLTTTVSGTNVSSPNCGLVANGAFDASGSNVDLASIQVAGIISTGGSNITNAPVHSLQAKDPCMTNAGCRYLTNNPPSATCNQPGGAISGQIVTLNPGTYCSPITISGSIVTLNPGLYVVPGITASGSNVSGSGVTFYVTSGSYNLSGSNGTITPPASGNYSGVGVYQVSSDTTPSVVGGSNAATGLLYFPTAPITSMGSNSSTPSLLIAASISFQGSNTTDPGFSNSNALLHKAVLAE